VVDEIEQSAPALKSAYAKLVEDGSLEIVTGLVLLVFALVWGGAGITDSPWYRLGSVVVICALYKGIRERFTDPRFGKVESPRNAFRTIFTVFLLIFVAALLLTLLILQLTGFFESVIQGTDPEVILLAVLLWGGLMLIGLVFQALRSTGLNRFRIYLALLILLDIVFYVAFTKWPPDVDPNDPSASFFGLLLAYYDGLTGVVFLTGGLFNLYRFVRKYPVINPAAANVTD
jgi:hypothetical protein